MNKIRKIKKIVSAKQNTSTLLVLMMLIAGFSAMFVIITSDTARGYLAYTDFNYSKRITIHATYIDEDLVCYPLWVYNTSDDFKDTGNGGNIQPDGDDISFFSSDNLTRYNHEIEVYDGTTGEIGIWVNMTTLNATTDTIIYMYYGNSSATNQQNPSGVWHSSYVMVLHMNGSGGDGSLVYDSTSNNNHGTKGGDTGYPYETTGSLGYGQQFEGTTNNQYLNCSSDATLDFSGTDSFTLEAWYRVDNETGATGIKLFAKDDTSTKHRGWYTQVYDNGDGGPDDMYFYASETDDGAVGDREIELDLTGVNVDDGSWHYSMLVVDWNAGAASDLFYYENGSFEDDRTFADINQINPNADINGFWIGCHEYAGGGWDGAIDEVRVSNVARNGSYTGATYNNTNSPSTFLTFGAEIGNASSFQINGLNNNRITWSSLQDTEVWCNATGSHHETMEINMTISSEDNVTEIRVWIGDLNNSAPVITADNIAIQFSSDNSTWGANVRSFVSGGSNISVNDTTWTTANGCYGTDPFSGAGLTDKTTSIYCRFRITYPSNQPASIYYSATSTTCKVYIGYF